METSAFATFAAKIAEGFSATAIWGTIGDLSDFMIGAGLIALGYYLFRRVSKGAVKLKFRP